MDDEYYYYGVDLDQDYAPSPFGISFATNEKLVVTTAAEFMENVLRHSEFSFQSSFIELQDHIDLREAGSVVPNLQGTCEDTKCQNPILGKPSARYQIDTYIRSIRGNCGSEFADHAQEMDPPLPEWDPVLRQCVILLPEPGPNSTETSLVISKDDDVTTTDADPVWISNLIIRRGTRVTSSNSSTSNPTESVKPWNERGAWDPPFLVWSNRAMYMTHVTLQGVDEPSRAALWTQGKLFTRDVNFSDWAPGQGSGVVSAAVESVYLQDSAFQSCSQPASSNGLIDSYSGARVALDEVDFSQSTSSFHLFNQGGSDVTDVFFSDAALPVGGGLQSTTLSLSAVEEYEGEFLAETDSQLNQIKLEERQADEFDASVVGEALPAGIVVLIVVSVCAVLGCCLTVAWFIFRRYKHREAAVSGHEPSAAADVSQPKTVTDSTGSTSSVGPFLYAKEQVKRLWRLPSVPSSQPTASLGMPSHIFEPSDLTRGSQATLVFTETLRPNVPQADASTLERKTYLDQQLDSLREITVLGGLTFMPGLHNRLHGGQALVQIAEHREMRQQYAVKFFLSRGPFEQEAKLYEDPDQPLGRFLPELSCIVDEQRGGEFKDRYGDAMPPCIVMEKGEALDVWAARSGGPLDTVTGLQVLTHVAERLKDLHAAGYVHRDIKPGNIMWLPRKNRWTLIDFGCAAQTGSEAPTGFSLMYAAPEVVEAYTSNTPAVTATEALDAWSVGILALEMFSGRKPFDVAVPKAQVISQILGQQEAPWEGEHTAPPLLKKLGYFRGAVLSLLARNALERPSMAEFQLACNRVLSSTITDSKPAT